MNETLKKALQPTAGRFDAPYKIVKTTPFEVTLSPASVADLVFLR
jgi:hypothetical protein